MHDIDPILRALSRRASRRNRLRRRLQRAAVAVVLRASRQGVEVLLVERSARDGDPWSGDMAFPGGKLVGGDAGGAAAACRETREETGLIIGPGERAGRLRDRLTLDHRRRRAMVVSPFVFRLAQTPDTWHYNHEVASHLWLPLAYLDEPGNRGRMRWPVGGLTLPLPCYDFQQRRIWGLTLLMLDELIALARAGR